MDSNGAVMDRTHLYWALVALMCVICIGTSGFMIIEPWDLWEALYFTLITITTVGYGDEGISATGKKFASFMLIGGIGIASYTFALVVQYAVTLQFAWKERMQSTIDKLEGHVIVCGFGRMGSAVCDRLAEAGRDVVVIESNEQAFELACRSGHLAIQAIATEDDALEGAGLRRATHLVAAVDCETDNIVITLSSREINPDVTILARAERDQDHHKLRRAGADRIISPFQIGGREIATAITRPKVAEFLASTASGDGSVALAEITIHEGSSLVGRSLKDYGMKEGSKISFVSLQRPEEEPKIPPRGTDEMQSGDLLIIAGDVDQIAQMKDDSGGAKSQGFVAA